MARFRRILRAMYKATRRAIVRARRLIKLIKRSATVGDVFDEVSRRWRGEM